MSTISTLLKRAQDSPEQAESVYKEILGMCVPQSVQTTSNWDYHSLYNGRPWSDTNLTGSGGGFGEAGRALSWPEVWITHSSLFLGSDFTRNAQGLAEVITQSRAFMSSTAKAKTAKLSKPLFMMLPLHALMLLSIVRTLLDFFNSIPESHEVQMKTLTDNIQWAKSEKRIFLKHNLEIRLAGL